MIARDGGKVPHEGFAKVIVTLIDVNDNNPVFEPTAYQVKVSKRTLSWALKRSELRSHILGVRKILVSFLFLYFFKSFLHLCIICRLKFDLFHLKVNINYVSFWPRMHTYV